MQFTDLIVFIVLILLSVLGIAFFLLAYLGTNYSIKDEENYSALIQAYGFLYDEEELENEKSWKSELPAYMATYFQTMEKVLKDLYLNQLIVTIITAMAFLVIIASWLLPRGTFWGFTIAFTWGVIVTCVLAYLIYSVKLGTLIKVPIKAGISKEDVLKWIYGNGFILGLCIVATITLNLLFVTLIMKALAIIKISPHRFALEMIGYPTGILIGGIYFREGMSVTGRGILAACDLMIKKDQYFGQIGNALSYTTKIAAGLSSVISDVNYFDCMLAVALFLTAPQIVMVNAEEYQLSDNFLGNMFGLPLIFILSWIGAVITSFLINTLKNDDSVAYTASNIRFQILISIALSFIFMILALFQGPDKYEFGDKAHPQLHRENIYRPQVLGSGFLGILISSILLIYSEYLTSHGYQPVINIACQSKNAPTLNIINAYYLGQIGQFIPILLIGLALFFAYQLCSLVGFIGLLCGFVMNILILMPIQFLGNSSNDGLKAAFLGQFTHGVIDRLHSISWAAKNYGVWLRINNCGQLIIASVMLIGCTIYYSKTFILLLNGYNIFGLLIGAGLAQFNKGITLFVVKVLCEEALFDEKVMQTRKNKPDEDLALENYQYSYFPMKNRQANYYVLVNLLTCSIVVIFTGILLGHSACIAMTIGYLLTVAILSISSIITGSSLKAAYIYNTYDDQLQDNSQVLATNLYGDIQATTVDESQNCPQAYYMVFVMTISILGIELFMGI